jgi:hypothetical protein
MEWCLRKIPFSSNFYSFDCNTIDYYYNNFILSPAVGKLALNNWIHLS